MKKLLTALALLTSPLQAQELPCRLALAMGLDISSSVNSSEYALQLDGLIAAFRDEEIRAAMADNDIRSVGHYRSIDLQRMLTLLGRLLAEP